MLRYTATKLRSIVRPEDFVARIGGDEFVIISNTAAWGTSIEEFANQIVEEFQKPFELEEGIVRIGVSVGIANTNQSTDLLRDAGFALYEARRNGRNPICLFSSHLRDEALDMKRMADDIIRSLESEEFVPFFQPQLYAKTRRVVGVEALARWEHPSRRTLPPIDFLIIAEEVGLINQIDTQISNAAIQAHNKSGQHCIEKLSLNICQERLTSDAFFETLGHASDYDFRIAYELLESIAFDGVDERVIVSANEVKARGFEVEIDDFGTGRASIVGLLKVTPDRLKIDRQLVMPILGRGPERRLVQMIVEIATILNIDVVAEGVETVEHAELLRKLQINTLQGYAFAKPLAISDLTDFVERSSAAGIAV